ncbi:unnamed protein product [Phytophthora fragariaefolia]|uniref:Unnamed protein product n=1 Tax=Phytophthora fragariaefolia TaxID=1490495 RepID=A0A9W6Y335_9STRA|nr:unnamed protein product [Phytophthora fragariaefolia]
MPMKPNQWGAKFYLTCFADTAYCSREPDGSVSVVPCPQLVRDYHEAMGGVDVRDQLRLQRYSIQRAIPMRKYYEAICLGLVDLAMVNAFIIHKIAIRRRGKPVPAHAAFLRALHTDLINQTSEDFAGRDDMADVVAEPFPHVAHALEKTDQVNGAKRRQWLCDVCFAYTGAGVRSFDTIHFCASCSRAKKGRVTLCNKPRRVQHGSSLTCAQMWHQSWKNGRVIPAELQHKIRFVSKRRAEVESEADEE